MRSLVLPLFSRRRDSRPLLLAAALAVAVPGILVSCSGQAGSGAGASQNDSVNTASRATTANRAPAAPRRPGGVRGVQLLAQAAQAAILTSFQGQEVVTRWSNGGGTVLVSDIWHASGGQTVTRTLDAGASSGSQLYRSSDTDGRAPEGVFGVTAPLLGLLEKHYMVVYAGTGSADDRTAQVVEAWRSDGSIAARFWLDEETKLPLERQVFDSASRVISQDVFIDIRFADSASDPNDPNDAADGAAGGGTANDAANGAAATANSDAISAAPQGPWTDPLSRTELLSLRARGWQVPAQLPGGLQLFTGAETEASTGTVLDLGYSDGLSVISVFEQHGNLAAKLDGWRKTTVDGHQIFMAEPDHRSLTWSSRGMVYTVMVDAPADTVTAVVGVLPHDKPAGFWKRMSRGMVRLASWVNPFH